MPPRLPTPRSSSPLPRHAAALLTGLCLLLTAHAAHAARLALVVGNDSYRHVDPLKNAVRDAELMQKTLADAGFQVTLQRNVGRQALYDAVDQFQRLVNNGDEVVFFFAGHGVQVASDQVLLPVDIQADDEKKVLREGVPLLYVQEALKGARLALVVVDACRDNPFPKTGGTRSIGDSRGLKPPEAAKGQAVILSAGRGERALDTVPGQPTARNGLFTWEFAQVLRTPGLDVLTALRRVRDRVEDRAATVGHQQRPSLVDDLRGQFYLAAGPQGPESKPEPVPVPQTQPQPQAVQQQSPAPDKVALSKPASGAAEGGALMTTDRRTSGAQLEDQAIERKGESRLRTVLGERAHLNISSYNRTVLITGEVAREADRELAERTVQGIENVKDVLNEAAVAGLSSLTSRANDTLISSKVKASILDTKDLQPNSIRVVGERSIIYLMGRVTEREAARAAEAARGVSGVQKIVRLFELVSEDELKALQLRPTSSTAPAPLPTATLIDGRYQVLGDGSEVKDVQTGLVWARCSVGQTWDGKTCAGEAKKFTFDDAQKLAGTGWRVPTIRELASLIYCSSGKTKYRADPQDGGGAIANVCDGEYQRPTLREQAFPKTPADWYWSSSPYSGSSSFAWLVGFGYGYVDFISRSSYYAVRLVRASQ